MENKVALRFSKIWLSTKDPTVVMQANILGPLRKSCSKKKLFVVMDTRQDSFGLRLLAEKPSNLTAHHAVINILRKYTPTFTVNEIYKNSIGDLILPIKKADVTWKLLLKKSRPPEIWFVDNTSTSLIRYGIKGTFTKKKTVEIETEEVKNILSDLVSDFIKKYPNDIEAESSSVDEGEIEDNEATSKEQKEILSRLKRKLKSSKKSLLKQTEALPGSDEVLTAEKHAKLLQSYGYLVNEGDFELKLSPEMTGEDSIITIGLDPEKSLGYNLDLLFSKVKKSHRALKMGQEQIRKLEATTLRLEKDVKHLRENILNSIELDDIRLYHKLPIIQINSKSKELVSLPYKTYLSSTGHKILVGKGPKENDELTKSAKSNDYWLHAAGVSGSHVVIPVTADIRDSAPSLLIKEAAMLAIYFSKFKGDSAGESYFAKKSQIKKRKGMPAGLWNVERCETVYVKFTSDELKAVLSTLER